MITEPTAETPLPVRPWGKLANDLFMWKGHTYTWSLITLTPFSIQQNSTSTNLTTYELYNTAFQ